MTTIAAKGYCPGALRPMATGDGFLVRLRIVNGALPCRVAEEIAGLSEQFGNGLIDLSARANLQLRGVAAGDLGRLQGRLAELGLLDSDAGAEAVRNVIASPLAGYDASAVLDARPLVSALDARLSREPALHALPGKFGFLIDGGGALALTGVEADIAFHALRGVDGPRMAVRLGGEFAGFVSPEDVPDAASALARAFLALRAGERRMRALIERLGVAAIACLAGGSAPDEADNFPLPAVISDVLGVHSALGESFVGAAAAFGQWSARDLRTLARRAEHHGARELRLTPWRAILAPGLKPANAHVLHCELAAAGLLVDAADPLLRLAACSGKPACASAHADVRLLARSLAPRLSHYRGILHVSGCAKGCAHDAPAPLTFLATPEGYDVISNGLARDAPIERGCSALDLARHLEGRAT